MNNAYLEGILHEELLEENSFDRGLTILLSGPIAPMISFSSMGSAGFRSPSAGSGYRSLGVDLTLLPDLGSFSIRHSSPSSYISPIKQSTLDYILESTKPFQIPSTSLRSFSTSSFKSLIGSDIIEDILKQTKKFEIPSASIQPLGSHDYGYNRELSWMNHIDPNSLLSEGIKSPSTSLRSFSTPSFKSSISDNLIGSILESTKSFQLPSAEIKPLTFRRSSDNNSLISDMLESTKQFQVPSTIRGPILEGMSRDNYFGLNTVRSVKEILGFDPAEIDYTNWLSKSVPKIEPEHKFWEIPKINIPRLDLPKIEPEYKSWEFPEVKIDLSSFKPKNDFSALDFLKKSEESSYKYKPTYIPPLILDDEDSKVSPLRFARKLIDDGFLERYKEIQAGLKLSSDAVSSLRLTGSDRVPSFNYEDHSINIPAITPKEFNFLHDRSEDDYRHIAINSFLPHEQGHAKVFSTFKSESLKDDDLKGFNEHLADTFVAKSNIPDLTRTKLWDAENRFQSSTFKIDEQEDKPYLKTDYTRWLREENSFLLGHHTNIQELSNLSQFRERETSVLRESLVDLGYKPKTTIDTINDLAKDYKSASESLFDFSQRFQIKIDSVQIKVDSILEGIRKKTSKFWDNL